MVENLRALAADGIWATGMMSGTSLDGVDVALLRSDGEQIFEFGPTAYRPYSVDEQVLLRTGLGLWHDAPTLPSIAKLIEAAHLSALDGLPRAQLIGFHGQTLAHDPGGRGTHQAGDGAALARAIGLPVVWDFRSNDVQMGGQGAPLAPFFHFACTKYLGLTGPTVFLNLGGVGNITWVDPSYAAPDHPQAILAFDTGPANAPMNDIMQRYFNQPYDANGDLAARGQVDKACVADFVQHDFFAKAPPKSLDRDSFVTFRDALHTLDPNDALATATEAAALAVAKGLLHCPITPQNVILCGGGRRNMHLRSRLKAHIQSRIVDCDDLGLNGDMLEAQAFAFLAIRSLRGLALSSPQTTAVPTPCHGGKISFP